jgi:multiple sugar transport system permease protein
VVALLFRVIDGLKTFDSIQVLTGGGPGSATTTLNMLAYRQGLQFLNFGRGASVAVVLLILAIVFGNVAIRTMRRGTYR